ncbi:MAG: hypothetical protein VXZ84_02440, partial [Planctomycetota bacterium]|nr:hypothetical protein [Planctomycetota bacterium]
MRYSSAQLQVRLTPAIGYQTITLFVKYVAAEAGEAYGPKIKASQRFHSIGKIYPPHQRSKPEILHRVFF